MTMLKLSPVPAQGPTSPQALEHYPASWNGPARIGMVILIIAFGGFLGWSISAMLASAVVASGSVVVENNRKAVQHLEGGIVRELLVQEGDYVEKGQALIRLDPIQTRAEREVLAVRIAATRAQIARLEAEQRGRDGVDFPDDLKASAARSPAIAEILESEREFFAARRANLMGERSILSNRRTHARDMLEAVRGEIESTERQIALLTEELAGAEALLKKGYAPKTRVLALKRERERLRGLNSQTQAEIAQQQQTISETELQILQLEKTFFEKAAEELREAQGRLGDLLEQATAASDKVERLELQAPVSGYVVNLKTHNQSAVVKPGETLMEIVPKNERLIVEAMVPPTDIDSVSVGQLSEVRFTALPSRDQEPVFGKVDVISADRLVDEATNTPYYAVRVVVEEQEWRKLPKGSFKPGLPTEVLILGSDRTLLSYLTDPLFKSLRRSFREE